MLRTARIAAGAIGLSLVLMVSALAQTPVRIRGTIEKVDGQILSIKSREGQDLTVKLTPNVSVSAIVKASLSDIKVGTFVGIAALADGKGGWRALEVLVFPEASRGSNEGDGPWDLLPESTMTNATVTDVVSGVSDHTLTLKFKDGAKTFAVPSETPIVTYAPGDKSDLKPGAKIFVFRGMKQEDGTVEAGRLSVGRGIDPPM